jgi:hypothetical protein
VISEWWWIGKDLVGSGSGLILRYYSGICLEGLRKTMKNFKQDSRKKLVFPLKICIDLMHQI